MSREINLSQQEKAYLFPTLPNKNNISTDSSKENKESKDFRLIFDSIYSMSSPKQAKAVLNILHYFFKKSQLKDKVLVDATAHVGGNTFPFIGKVKKLICCEIQTLTSQLLQHNINVYSKLFLPNLQKNDNTKNNEVLVLNQDFVQFDFQRYKPNIIIVDAPWGGPNYRRRKDKDLYLSNEKFFTNLATVRKEPDPNLSLSSLLLDVWFPEESVEIVILKVPTQYPTHFLILQHCKFPYYRNVNIVKPNGGWTSYKLLVFSKHKPEVEIPREFMCEPIPYRSFKPI